MPRKFTIGREKTCDFPVPDESVSRLHAEIWLTEDGALTLADHGSSNGTSLIRGGATLPLLQTTVLLTDEVKFGAAVLKVKEIVEALEAQNPGALTPKSIPPPLPPPPAAADSTTQPTAIRPVVVPPPPAPAPPASNPAPPPAPAAAPLVSKPAPPPPPPPPVPAPAAAPPMATPAVPPAAAPPKPAPPAAPPPRPKVEPAAPPPPAAVAGPPPPPPVDGPPSGADLLPAAPPPPLKVNPVVGWLVCLEGPDHGRDYPLRAGVNNLGRMPTMEVCIANDAAVSREKHCVISFDAVRETFMLTPSEGSHLLYLNGESIRSPRHLTRDDVIDVGRTKLVFIPFCDGKYRWSA